MTRTRRIDLLRSVADRARTALVVAANIVACELGARIGLPGVDGSRVQAFFQGDNRGLLAIYNFLAGGGVSRAGIFALGIIPYLQARLYLGLARRAFPTLRRLTNDARTKQSVVRVATVTLAALQAFGFARFLQSIPGAVAEPGGGFVSRTVLLLTGGAIVVGWLAELVGPAMTDSPADARDMPARERLAPDALACPSITATVRPTMSANNAANSTANGTANDATDVRELSMAQLLASERLAEIPRVRAEHVEISLE